MPIQEGKVVIIGAGMVGSATLSAVLREAVVNEIVLIDMNTDKAQGEVLDASHTTAFAYSSNVNIHTGDYSECEDAHIIIMSAGPSITKDNVMDRSLLLNKNIAVMDDVMKNITKYTREAIIIVISNPLDALVYYGQSAFDYPRHKMIGTGTLLDTARLRKIIGENCGVDSKNVHGYVLGEHGESAFVTWSDVNISGIPFEDLNTTFGTNLKKKEIYNEMRSVGFDILQLKGYTNIGVAAACARIVKCIVLNEKSVLPISSVPDGAYGISDVALSLPCIVGSEGIDRILEIPLTIAERACLERSTTKLKEENAKIER
ncbi:L-lactate dehydrogenase [Erysipelotrichaceae bacterium MTC7]|nr:L-lactate dehydrogenase [Erysipelotrichaceae bacterium MTC7]